MPSYKQCIGFGKAIGWEPENELQHIALNHICTEPYNGLQAARQAMKTELHGIHGATGIAIGEPCGIGMPTLAQGGRILASRIEKKLSRFEKLPGINPKRMVDNSLYKVWHWHEQSILGVVTMHETGDIESTGKSVQGYTFRNLKVDEAHECGLDVYGKLLPTTNRYREQGLANIGLLGVGGYSHSLIETKKREDVRFKCLRIIPDLDNKYVPKGQGFIVTPNETIYDLLFYKPQAREFYQEERANSPERDWSQHYLCETQHGGSGRIFRNLSGGVALPANAIVAHEVGVDVGGGSDKTVMYIVETARNYISGKFYGGNVIERNEICTDDFEAQAKWTWEILDRYEQTLDLDRMLYEGNNVGKYYGKEVTKHPVYKNFRKFHTSDQGSAATNNKGIKTLLIEKLMSMNLDGLIGVPDESAYKALSTLTYELSDGGVYKWPHSDDLSAFWVWAAGMESARGI